MAPNAPTPSRRLLLTAGPTHEPIDAVRYLGNRSSGRLGVALADEAAARGWDVTLLLGPTHLSPADTRVQVERFRTTADLQALLDRHAPGCDALVMAAAVADYRPKAAHGPGVKLTRTAQGMTLELEGTPDLLAACSARKRAGQVFIGFALEPRERMLESATRKLHAKGLDAIVANPLETMDADTIECVLLTPQGDASRTDGAVTKAVFSGWLLDRLAELMPDDSAVL